MYPRKVGEWIKQYQKDNELEGSVNKRNVYLSCGDVVWYSLDYVNNVRYPMDGMEGRKFTTEIGFEVEIFSGKLRGLHRKLSLSLEGLPRFVRNLMPVDTIDIDLAHREDTIIQLFKDKFRAPERTLARNRRATFECEVELKGFVLFNTSSSGGRQQSTDQADITEIVRRTRWTVEGECTFHLGLNDSLKWI